MSEVETDTEIVEYREVETRMRNMTEEEMMKKSTRRVHRHHNSLFQRNDNKQTF